MRFMKGWLEKSIRQSITASDPGNGRRGYGGARPPEPGPQIKAIPASHAPNGAPATLYPGFEPRRDPFDRMSAAQALIETLRVATPDSEIAALGADTIW